MHMSAKTDAVDEFVFFYPNKEVVAVVVGAMVGNVSGNDEQARVQRLAILRATRDKAAANNEAIYVAAANAGMTGEPRTTSLVWADIVIKHDGDVIAALNSDEFTDKLTTELDLDDGFRFVSDEEGERYVWEGPLEDGYGQELLIATAHAIRVEIAAHTGTAAPASPLTTCGRCQAKTIRNDQLRDCAICGYEAETA